MRYVWASASLDYCSVLLLAVLKSVPASPETKQFSGWPPASSGPSKSSARAVGDRIEVDVRLAQQHVAATAADEFVDAGFAFEGVVTRAAAEDVGGVVADDASLPLPPKTFSTSG